MGFDKLNCVLPYANVTLLSKVIHHPQRWQGICESATKGLLCSHPANPEPAKPPRGSSRSFLKRAKLPWRRRRQRNTGALTGACVPPLPGKGRVAVVLRLVVWVAEQTRIERGRGGLIRAASDTAPGGSAHNSSPFMTGCTF